MIKSELIESIVTDMGYSKIEVSNIVSAVFDTIKKEVVEGREVSIADFGKFFVRTVGERKGRNIQTGEIVKIPAYKKPTFKSFTKFKKSVKAK